MNRHHTQADWAERARAVLPDDATAEGRAFHAADCIDRVLQIAQHLRAATLTMVTVLDEMELDTASTKTTRVRPS